jgi:hypothetical protein
VFSRYGSWLIGPLFVVIAIGLWLLSQNVVLPVAPTPDFLKEDLKTGVFRVALNDPPVVEIGGFQQSCNDCHQIFTSQWDPSRPLSQHTHIEMSHGINDHCLNCHDSEDRDKLILRGGEKIGFSESPRLCQQCHGPVYNDWTRGEHGKTMGSWIMGSDEQYRLRCNECHDPHSPAYVPMAPLPGPNTLRQGDPHANGGAHGPNPNNPLLRWQVHEHPEASTHTETSHTDPHENTEDEPEEQH